jgi:hypothetical protein
MRIKGFFRRRLREGGYPAWLTAALQIPLSYKQNVGEKGWAARFGAHFEARRLEQTHPPASSSKAQLRASRSGETDASRESLIEPIGGRPDSVVRIYLAYRENTPGGEDAHRLTDKELLARWIEIVQDVYHRDANERPGWERPELFLEIADLETRPAPDRKPECRRLGKSNAIRIVVDADDLPLVGAEG